ncbi:hypothetical protein MMC27_003562 [Xylographa pallens]|nr:hypothetical protein [Xylographa pallens]
MGRPQRRSAASLCDSEQGFGGEDESRQSCEAYVSGSMYPMLQYDDDALMDVQTSDGMFSIDGSDVDAAQADTSWNVNFPPLVNDKRVPSPPMLCIPPDLSVLDHFNGPMLFNEQNSGNATNNSIGQNQLEHAASIRNNAAATKSDVGVNMGISLSTAEILNTGIAPHEEDLRRVTQLFNLTVELCKHPLYNAAPQSRSPPNPRTMTTPPDSTHSASETVHLADLEIGQLLSMTTQLSNLVAQIGSVNPQTFMKDPSPADTSGQKQRLQSRSTILLVLSCYSRLEMIFLSTIDALREVQKSGKRPEDLHRLLPRLVVDGFSFSTCQDLQLRFVVQLCEQALEIIRTTTGQCGKANAATFDDIGNALGKFLTSRPAR